MKKKRRNANRGDLLPRQVKRILLNFSPLGNQRYQQMTDVLAGWPGTKEYDGGAGRPGGGARGKQKIEAADKWRKPAAALAEKIWQNSPGLRTTTVRKRVRNSLPEDEQPPSDRALEDHIRPLKP